MINALAIVDNNHTFMIKYMYWVFLLNQLAKEKQIMYHTLYVDFDKDGSFGLHFGDYDKATVKQEARDVRDSEDLQVKHVRIVSFQNEVTPPAVLS